MKQLEEAARRLPDGKGGLSDEAGQVDFKGTTRGFVRPFVVERINIIGRQDSEEFSVQVVL